MDWDGIVNAGGDAALAQRGLHAVAILDFDDVEMIDVALIVQAHRRLDADFAQKAVVCGGMIAASLVPPIEVGELYVDTAACNESRRQLSPLTVCTYFFAWPRSCSKHNDSYRAASLQTIAPPSPYAPRFFCGIETETSHVPEASGAPAFISCAMRLAGILDHTQTVAPGESEYGFHRNDLTVQMHRHDCFSARRDRRFEQLRIDQVRTIHLDQHGARSDGRNCQRRRNERIGRNDDLVSRPDPQGSQGQLQRPGPRFDAHAIAGADIGRKVFFKERYVGTENEARALHHLHHPGTTSSDIARNCALRSTNGTGVVIVT